ncbi:hypothetical protein GPJ56_010284 [Histomonas meleagridis]|uniref:uncharacterized protein n=1 Tax=Histomonas meleagridis TaxID=135588 RepID=UPI00355A4502|nr:hypothetical protein GPJ56_010284 [Histomonas meleagridis]KAH0797153.1 hypothetical protein GO595_011046 [Histomonas meleagridis]
MNFRYGDFGQDENEQDGPLFYSNLTKVLDERRILPEIAIIISVENQNDFVATNFWRNPEIIQYLTGKARVLRINISQEAYQQFTQLFPVTALPSLFVFGPGSSGPSFSYSGRFPSVIEFRGQYESLPPYQPPLTIPQTTVPTPTQPPEIDDNWYPKHRFQSQSNQTQTEPKPTPTTEPMSVPKPKKKPAPKPEPKPQSPPTPVEVTLITLNQRTYTEMFMSNDNVVKVYAWAAQKIGQPQTNFNLLVQPNNSPIPQSTLIQLKQYGQKFTVKVTMKNKNNGNNTNRLIAQIKNFFREISIFADPKDDPTDFWRLTPPQGRGAPNQRQTTNFRANNQYYNGNGINFE